MRSLVSFLLACAIALGAAEYMTRRSAATLRWCILAVIWVLLLAMVVSVGDF